TNETLAALFVTAALYFCLRVLRSEVPSTRLYAAVGVCLGLAMLTKFSALLAILPIFGALLWRGASSQNPESRNTPHVSRFTFQASRPMLLTLAACLLVCGWHYARVWLHFGNPLIGNWDPRLPFAWWQDPGCHTSGWF